jgi:hypothetical protein
MFFIETSLLLRLIFRLLAVADDEVEMAVWPNGETVLLKEK